VVRLKMAECLAGLTFTSGVPQVANDAALDSRVNRTSARSLGVRNLACVPLQHRGRVIGVLFVGNKKAGPFTSKMSFACAPLRTMPPSLWRTRAFSARRRTPRNTSKT